MSDVDDSTPAGVAAAADSFRSDDSRDDDAEASARDGENEEESEEGEDEDEDDDEEDESDEDEEDEDDEEDGEEEDEEDEEDEEETAAPHVTVAAKPADPEPSSDAVDEVATKLADLTPQNNDTAGQPSTGPSTAEAAVEEPPAVDRVPSSDAAAATTTIDTPTDTNAISTDPSSAPASSSPSPRAASPLISARTPSPPSRPETPLEITSGSAGDVILGPARRELATEAEHEIKHMKYAREMASQWSSLLQQRAGPAGVTPQQTAYLLEHLVPILVESLGALLRVHEREARALHQHAKKLRKNPSMKPMTPMEPLEWLASYLVRHNPKHVTNTNPITAIYEKTIREAIREQQQASERKEG